MGSVFLFQTYTHKNSFVRNQTNANLSSMGPIFLLRPTDIISSWAVLHGGADGRFLRPLHASLWPRQSAPRPQNFRTDSPVRQPQIPGPENSRESCWDGKSGLG